MMVGRGNLYDYDTPGGLGRGTLMMVCGAYTALKCLCGDEENACGQYETLCMCVMDLLVWNFIVYVV